MEPTFTPLHVRNRAAENVRAFFSEMDARHGEAPADAPRILPFRLLRPRPPRPVPCGEYVRFSSGRLLPFD